MSLINQMLRDLESRRQVGNHQLPPGEVPAVVQKDRSSYQLFILAGGGLLLIGFAWLGLNFPAKEISIPATQQPGIIDEQRRLIPSRSTQVAPLAAVPEESQKRSASSVEQVPTAVLIPEENSTAQVSAVPTAALKKQTAIGNDPATLLNIGILETSASARLLFEFEMPPVYQLDQKGADNKQLLLHFPRTKAQAALEIPQLQGPLLQGLSLQQDGPGLKLLVDLNQPAQIRRLELPADSFHGHRLLVEVLGQKRVMPSASQGDLIPRETAAEKLPGNSPLPAEVVNKSTKTPGHDHKARQAYQDGLEQLAGKDHAAAEKMLLNALLLQPQLLPARLQLIELLLQQQRHAEAEKQLSLGLQIHPQSPRLRKTFARFLLAADQPGRAIDLLQGQPLPGIARDQEYHALLAALSQEVGNYATAARIYQQLLEVRPQEALWWMGLAISLEQTGKFDRAGKAYSQALALQKLSPELQKYVSGRLQEL